MLGDQGSRNKICQVKRPSVWGKCPSPHPLLDVSGVTATSPCRLFGSGQCEGQVREATQSRDPRAACQPRKPQEMPAWPAACGPTPPDTHRMDRFHSEEEEERERERASERQREEFGKTERRQRGRCRQKSSWAEGSQVVDLSSCGGRAEGVGPGCQLSSILWTHRLCLTQSRTPVALRVGAGPAPICCPGLALADQ